MNILKWLTGVRIEDFLQSFTEGMFQGIPMHSYYPEPQKFDNYVPQEFETFIDNTVNEWESLGMLRKWERVSKLPHSISGKPSRSRAFQTHSSMGWKVCK